MQKEKRSRTPTAAYLARAGIIAALYVAVTFLLSAISFGPVQVRIAEGLTLLPVLFPEAIVGLFLGCLLANFFGPFGMADIVFGSLITLLAACITRRFRHNKLIAYLSPIILNAFLVSLYLYLLFAVPYWPTVLSIGLGQSIAVLGIGIPLLHFIEKHK
ncbi:MAG: QueT transporter family protein [Firmicutes bacterium]|nr:QueT transporter family protein [Bacillota bacterium]